MMLRKRSTVKRSPVLAVDTASLPTTSLLLFLGIDKASWRMLGSGWFLTGLRLNYQLALWFFRLACLLYLLSGLQCYASRISLMLLLNLVRDNSYKMLGTFWSYRRLIQLHPSTHISDYSASNAKAYSRRKRRRPRNRFYSYGDNGEHN